MQVTPEASPEWLLAQVCRAVYDPRLDDANFLRSLQGDAATRRAAFDQLRKHYPYRREIDGLRVRLQGDNPAQSALLRALGVQLV